MQEERKIREKAEVIICHSRDLERNMNSVIEAMNKQNFTVKHHSITCKIQSMDDVICTIIFEEKSYK